jgi:hypothetical protein
MSLLRMLFVSTAALSLGLPAATAWSASHLWVINEIFSDASGSVQFIEMHVPADAANERFMTGKYVRSAATDHRFTFPNDLPVNSTAFAYLLLATEAFAGLPGAPPPDFIIQEDFFDLVADEVQWWVYNTGDLAYTAGELPLDGVTSLNFDGSTGVNSPTNFDGETGSIHVEPSSVPSVPGSAAAPFYLHVLGAPASFGGVDLEFRVPDAGSASLRVFDTAGRLVRRMYDGAASGPVRVRWDGFDGSGTAAESGVYLVRLESGGRVAARKVPLLR